MSSYFNAHQKRSIFALSRLRPSMLIDNIKIAHILIRERTQSCLSGKNTAWIGKELAENFQKNEFAVLLKLENFLVSRSQHSFTSCWRRRTSQIAFLWKPILQRRSILIRHSNIPDLQSHFFMLFYSYWQNMMHCCILLTVNLLTWRKVLPVFYWKTEPFILAHDKFVHKRSRFRHSMNMERKL